MGGAGKPAGPGVAASRKLAAGVLLTAIVTLVHLWLAGRVMPDSLALPADRTPARLEVAFVAELAPAVPTAVAPRAPVRPAPSAPPRQAAPSPLPAASAPDSPRESTQVAAAEVPRVEAPTPAAPPASGPGPADVQASSPPSVPTPEVVADAASAAASAASSAVSASAFEWPPSTRLSYRLTGDFRGPVEGQAQVEWLRDGMRYQVHLDVGVGPSFAPLLSRRTSSEGRITAEGLRPERFDEATQVLLRDPRRQRIDMAGPIVRLANGSEVARPDGLQDTASQFVQLSWLFTNRPELLRLGQIVRMPLALPRRVEIWQYEVGETSMLDTPAGPVEAVHVRPRPDVADSARRSGELVPEAWFAPSLQYLPVRILIRQEGGNFVDLMMERLPQQAAPGR